MRPGTTSTPGIRVGRPPFDTSPVPLSSHRQIQVFDAAGKEITRLPDALEDFDTLAATLQSALAAKRDATEVAGMRAAGS